MVFLFEQIFAIGLSRKTLCQQVDIQRELSILVEIEAPVCKREKIYNLFAEYLDIHSFSSSSFIPNSFTLHTEKDIIIKICISFQTNYIFPFLLQIDVQRSMTHYSCFIRHTLNHTNPINLSGQGFKLISLNLIFLLSQFTKQFVQQKKVKKFVYYIDFEVYREKRHFL